MKLTGHKSESVYRRYAIVCESDLAEGVRKLAALEAARQPEERSGSDTVLAQIRHMAKEATETYAPNVLI